MFVIRRAIYILSVASCFTIISDAYSKKTGNAFFDYWAEKEEQELEKKKEDGLIKKRTDAYHECMIKKVKSHSTDAHRLTVSAYCSNKANKIKN